MSSRFHNQDTIADVKNVLFAAGVKLTPADLTNLGEEAERIAAFLDADRNWPEGFETQFNSDVQKAAEKIRKETHGGRPRDLALATAVHDLVNLYVQLRGDQIDLWKVPAGHNSHFPRFAAAVLAPVYQDQAANLVSNLAKFWQRERGKMKPIL